MGIRLLELKGDSEMLEFLLKISATEQILHWNELLLNKEKVKEYIKNNPFPKDEYYNENDFLNDLDCEGYIHLGVEYRETAEYIAELIGEMI